MRDDEKELSDPAALEALSGLASRFQGSDAQLMALKQMMALVRRQAVVMSFADVFLMLTIIFVALAGLALLLHKPASAGGGAGH